MKVIKVIINNLFGNLLCEHKYEFIKETQHYQFDSDERPYKTTKTYQCSKCLKTKIVEI